MYVLGIAGTAKNTGKTTTTMALLQAADMAGHRVVLTSIGYDGENLDNVTNLPKPRVAVKEDSLIVTANECVSWGTAKLEVLESFQDIRTPLGKICVARAVQPGTVVLAGPNKGSHLTEVIERITTYGADLMMVDGALNRIGPMVRTEGIVLATGAARNPVIEELAEETSALASIFNLPAVEPAELPQYDQDKITVVNNNGTDCLPINSLATADIARALAEKISPETEMVVIPGMVDCHSLSELAGKCGPSLAGKILVFQDSVKLLVGGNPINVSRVLETIIRQGALVKVVNKVPLHLITYNPFYPAYSFDNNTYSSSYVDAERLKEAMLEKVGVPVINVKKDSMEKAYCNLLRSMERYRSHRAAV